MYTRQQILQAIISDGQQMLREGQVADPQEFQQKLHLLDEQWQSVVKRANQRKAIIDNNVAQWNTYRNLVDKLSDWLNQTDDGLHVFDFTIAPMQKVRTLHEKLQSIHREFSQHEPMYQKVHEAGRILIQNSDEESQELVRANLDSLQQQWMAVASKIDDRRGHLEDLMNQWQDCENGIEDILGWLKDIRRSLSADLPMTFDDLQRELQKCSVSIPTILCIDP